MKKLGIIIITLLLSTTLVSAEEVTLTLDEAVAVALRDNPDVLISAQGVEKAKAQVREAWSEVLPSINFSASRLTTQNLRPKPYNTTQIYAGMQQILFSSGRIVNTIKYREFGQQVQEALLDKTKLDKVLEVKKAFCTLILARDLSRINKDIVDNMQEHLEFLQHRYQNGQASESDTLDVQASLSSVKKDYEISVNQAQSSESLLKKLLNMEESVTIKTDGEFTYEEMEVIYDKAILEAMSKRPEIRQYEAQIKASKKAVNVARSGGLPSIYASWDQYSGDKFLTETGAATGKWKNYNVYGFVFSWPVFDGFATKAKIEQAMVDLKEAELSRQKTARDIAFEVKSSYLSLKDAIAKIDSSQSDIILYKNNLATVKDKFNDGIASSLDLSDANLRYQLALFNKEQALYDYIIAKSAFEKATGGTYASAK